MVLISDKILFNDRSKCYLVYVQNLYMINKKAVLEDVIKIILWIVFFGIALIALYALFKKMTG